MRLSVFIALLFTYVIGCLAAAFGSIFVVERMVGDLGHFSVPIFAAIVLGLVLQATWIFKALMTRSYAKARARTEQRAAQARQRAADLPVWSDKPGLEAALRYAGLGEWAARIADLAKPCILLGPGSVDDAAPMGASRLGGQPDMPPDMDWPTRPPFTPEWEAPNASQAEKDVRNRDWPLSFVAQVDFAELHAVSPLDGFPSAGRLLFFCDPVDWPWGEAADQARVRIVFTELPRERLKRRAFPGAFGDPMARELMPRGHAFKPRALLPTGWLLPPPSRYINALDWPGWANAQHDAYELFWFALCARYPETFAPNGRSEIHQVGGIAWSIQELVEAKCAINADDGPQFADAWQLVLQIDSDVEIGMEWGDTGRLYVCARKQDLAAGRFDRCWTVMQCY